MVTELRLRGENSDGRAQSEVIGIILMLALVVVLSALIGKYVFGLSIVKGGEQAVGPQVSFETSVDGNELTIRHKSGATVETSELTVIGSENGEFSNALDPVGPEWTSGESISITLNDGETVRIVWESSTTDDSTVVFQYTLGG